MGGTFFLRNQFDQLGEAFGAKVGAVQLRQGKAVLQGRSQIIKILLIIAEHTGEHYKPLEVMAGQLVGSHPLHVNH